MRASSTIPHEGQGSPTLGRMQMSTEGSHGHKMNNHVSSIFYSKYLVGGRTNLKHYFFFIEKEIA